MTTTYTTGVAGLPNDDHFDLGAGDDALRFQGTSDAGGVFGGGDGNDTFIGNTDAPVSVDVPARSMTTEPGQRTDLSGFDAFVLSWSPDVTFRGGPGDEELTTRSGADAVMGAGDDTMTVPIDQVVRLSGGPGRDGVELQEFNNGGRPPRVSVVVDLGRDWLQLSGSVREGAHLDAEDVSVYGAFAVQVVGDAGPNEIEIHESCVQRVLAGGGNDGVDVELLWCRRGAEILGGAGQDRISGTEQADVLLGGPGRDRINGRAGMDRCDGEVEKRCEG